MEAKVRIFYQGQPVGQYVYLSRGLQSGGYWEYDPGFLVSGHQLSPFHLPLMAGVQGPFKAIRHSEFHRPGLMVDMLPDRFGRAVFGGLKSRGSKLELIEFLGNRTMGALYAQSRRSLKIRNTHAIDLREMREVIGRQDLLGMVSIPIRENKRIKAILAQSACSAGGMRPKLTVAMKKRGSSILSHGAVIPEGYEPWIVKLSSGKTPELRNFGCVEHAYMLMAQAAGIDVPKFRLVRDSKRDFHFAVRRFDRGVDPNHRIHMHSYGGLRHIDIDDSGQDYRDLLRTTYFLTRDHREVEKQFKRMLFNYYAQNHDDHVRNFSFLYEDYKWRLSPAYDLVFCKRRLGNHLSLNGKSFEIKAKDFCDFGRDFMIPAKRVRSMIDDVRSAIVDWPLFAEKSHVVGDTIESIQESLKNVGKAPKLNALDFAMI